MHLFSPFESNLLLHLTMSGFFNLFFFWAAASKGPMTFETTPSPRPFSFLDFGSLPNGHPDPLVGHIDPLAGHMNPLAGHIDPLIGHPDPMVGHIDWPSKL